MGEVFIARTPWDANPVAAVKRLRPDVARVPTFAERFRHEAELAVRLDHPNIVGTLDVGKIFAGQPEEQLYVASEMIFGKDAGMIADRLRERGQGAPVAVVIRLLLDALQGLGFVHGAREKDGRWLQLVHRDVTPGNLLVSYEGVAKLADFGLAKSQLTHNSQLTNHGEIIGTPHYMAPELIRGEKATAAADIYGLGAVTYRVLTGIAPHQGTTPEVLFKALSEKPRSLLELRPDLPAWFASLVHRMLEIEPARRPSDAEALQHQLETEAQESGLMLPHASVGRWLSALFDTERSQELDERERIEHLQPEGLATEGTVVLAKVVPGTRFVPQPKGSKKKDRDPESGAEFSEAFMRGQPKRESSVVVPEALGDEIDGLPTRAFPMPDGDREELKRITEASYASSSNQTPASESERSSIGTFDELAPVKRGATRLPGFVDAATPEIRTNPEASGLSAQAYPEPEAPEDLRTAILESGHEPTHIPQRAPEPSRSGPDRSPDRSPERERGRTGAVPPAVASPAAVPAPVTLSPPAASVASTPAGRRPRNADSVVVAPVVVGAERLGPAIMVSGHSDPSVASKPATVPPARIVENAESARARRALESQADAQALARGVSPATAIPAPPKPSSKAPLVFAGVALVLLMIAVGVGIGLGIASSRPRGGGIVAGSNEVLTRFQAAKKRLEERRAHGQEVPFQAWELISQAGAALLDGDLSTAARRIDELDRLVPP
jgi:serine/threonine-protein kinase